MLSDEVPQEETPDEAASEDVSQGDASPDDISLDDISLDDISLDDISMDDVSLDDMLSDEVPQEETPDEAASEDVSQEDASLDDISLDDISLDDISMDDAALADLLSDEVPKEETPDEAASEDVSQEDASLDDISMDDISLDDISLDDISMDDVSLDDISLDDMLADNENDNDTKSDEDIPSDDMPIDDAALADLLSDSTSADAAETIGEGDDDLSSLLAEMGQDEDLSEINDLLEKSSQGVDVDDDMLAMLESTPEQSGDGDGGEDSFDFFSGEESEGEPEDIREMTDEELAARDNDKDSKKKKKKAKKGRKKKGADAESESEEDAALASLLDDVSGSGEPKKQGFFAKLMSFLLEEDEEENAAGDDLVDDGLGLGSVSDENKEILDELSEEDKKNAKKKGKKEKKKKDKKGKKADAETGEGEEGEEGNEEEKGKKAKKKKKEKKEKKEEEPLIPEKKLSKKKVLAVFLCCATIAACIVVLSMVIPNYMQKRDARIAFDHNRYEDTYDLLYGKNLSEEDEILLEKSTLVLQMQRKLDSCENYEKLDMPLEALDALISGVERYNEIFAEAEQYRVGDDVRDIYEQILDKLSEYGVSESEAQDIIALGDNVTYTQKLKSIVYGTAYDTGEEPDGVKQDVLPEEQEIIDRVDGVEETADESDSGDINMMNDNAEPENTDEPEESDSTINETENNSEQE
jgi:hypothetical protein